MYPFQAQMNNSNSSCPYSCGYFTPVIANLVNLEGDPVSDEAIFERKGNLITCYVRISGLSVVDGEGTQTALTCGLPVNQNPGHRSNFAYGAVHCFESSVLGRTDTGYAVDVVNNATVARGIWQADHLTGPCHITLTFTYTVDDL